MRSCLLTGLLSVSLLSCKEESIHSEESPETPVALGDCLADDDAGTCGLQKNAEQKPIETPPAPKKPKPTCDQLGIPSWQGTISELTAFRCEKCHNANFAWKGVLLTNYQQFKANEVLSKGRIASNNLTEKLDPLEQGLFLEFFKNGMPEKESDCVETSE